MKRSTGPIHILLLLFLLLTSACRQEGIVDLQGLEARARGGEEAALGELVSLLGQEKNGIALKCYGILLDIGEQAIPFLLEKAEAPDRIQREYVIAALGTLKVKGAVETISGVLGNEKMGRRYVAAWALGEIGAPGGIPALLRALEDGDALVRRSAVRSLIRLNRAAVLPLLGYLDGASELGEENAIRALGDIADGRALDPLLARDKGTNRREVFLALGKLKDPMAEAALIAGLGDDDWRARMNAAMALGPLGGAAAVEPLRRTLEDERRVVREWSARSLEMITGQHILYRNAGGEYVAPYNIYH